MLQFGKVCKEYS